MGYEKYLPLYTQVAEKLLRQIENNTYQARDKLPSENELCAMYNVSRPTIRQALDQLEKDGKIYRVRGVGTFVSPYSKMVTFSYGGFTAQCKALGLEPTSKLISTEIIDHLPQIFLDYQENDIVTYPDNRYYALERLRMVNGKVAIVEKTFIPLYLYPDIPNSFDPQTSLYSYLDETYNVRRTLSRIILLPYQATKENSRLWGIPAKTPLLQGILTVFNQNKQILEYASSYYTSEYPMRFSWGETAM